MFAKIGPDSAPLVEVSPVRALERAKLMIDKAQALEKQKTI